MRQFLRALVKDKVMLEKMWWPMPLYADVVELDRLRDYRLHSADLTLIVPSMVLKVNSNPMFVNVTPAHQLIEPIQYSSQGLRDQTEQLASSFLSDSEFPRSLSPEKKGLEPLAGKPRQHDTIEETSEPVSPAGSHHDGPVASQLTEGLKKQQPRERVSWPGEASEMPPPQIRNRSPVCQAYRENGSPKHVLNPWIRVNHFLCPKSAVRRRRALTILPINLGAKCYYQRYRWDSGI